MAEQPKNPFLGRDPLEAAAGGLLGGFLSGLSSNLERTLIEESERKRAASELERKGILSGMETTPERAKTLGIPDVMTKPVTQLRIPEVEPRPTGKVKFSMPGVTDAQVEAFRGTPFEKYTDLLTTEAGQKVFTGVVAPYERDKQKDIAKNQPISPEERETFQKFLGPLPEGVTLKTIESLRRARAFQEKSQLDQARRGQDPWKWEQPKLIKAIKELDELIREKEFFVTVTGTQPEEQALLKDLKQSMDLYQEILTKKFSIKRAGGTPTGLKPILPGLYGLE